MYDNNKITIAEDLNTDKINLILKNEPVDDFTK